MSGKFVIKYCSVVYWTVQHIHVPMMWGSKVTIYIIKKKLSNSVNVCSYTWLL